MNKFDLSSNESYDQIESQLSCSKFLSGEDFPNSLDAEVYIAIKSKPPSKDSFPNFHSWFANISQFAESLLKFSLEAKTDKKTETVAQGGEEDDLFGSDDEETKAKNFMIFPPSHQPKSQPKKKGGQSIVIFEVRVQEADEDLDALARRIFEIELEGLVWRTDYKIEDHVYGMKKLVVGCTIEDDLVATEDFIEKIEEWDEIVSSTDIIAFQKV